MYVILSQITGSKDTKLFDTWFTAESYPWKTRIVLLLIFQMLLGHISNIVRFTNYKKFSLVHLLYWNGTRRTRMSKTNNSERLTLLIMNGRKTFFLQFGQANPLRMLALLLLLNKITNEETFIVFKKLIQLQGEEWWNRRISVNVLGWWLKDTTENTEIEWK